MRERIRVLVVDDSAFARKVMRELLSAEADIDVVGFARDGLDAIEKITQLEPDVLTLDLVMPGVDGVGVLRWLAERPNPPRAVVVSTADDASDVGVEALAAGAFTVVHKPTAVATDRLYEVRADLLANVRAAATSHTPAPEVEGGPRLLAGARKPSVDLLVIGASTGGPQAVARVLQAFGADFPVPIAVVLHMPAGYTAGYAARIDRDSALDVREASEGLVVGPGMAIIARAGVHLRLDSSEGAIRAHLVAQPIDSLHRPSVDVLFASAAEALGGRVLAVVLTGMGDDGLAGARAVRSRGGRVLVEDRSTCVVYGMPRAIRDAGLASRQVRLEAMAGAIIRELEREGSG